MNIRDIPRKFISECIETKRHFDAIQASSNAKCQNIALAAIVLIGAAFTFYLSRESKSRTAKVLTCAVGCLATTLIAKKYLYDSFEKISRIQVQSVARAVLAKIAYRKKLQGILKIKSAVNKRQLQAAFQTWLQENSQTTKLQTAIASVNKRQPQAAFLCWEGSNLTQKLAQYSTIPQCRAEIGSLTRRILKKQFQLGPLREKEFREPIEKAIKCYSKILKKYLCYLEEIKERNKTEPECPLFILLFQMGVPNEIIQKIALGRSLYLSHSSRDEESPDDEDSLHISLFPPSLQEAAPSDFTAILDILSHSRSFFMIKDKNLATKSYSPVLRKSQQSLEHQVDRDINTFSVVSIKYNNGTTKEPSDLTAASDLKEALKLCGLSDQALKLTMAQCTQAVLGTTSCSLGTLLRRESSIEDMEDTYTLRQTPDKLYITISEEESQLSVSFSFKYLYGSVTQFHKADEKAKQNGCKTIVNHDNEEKTRSIETKTIIKITKDGTSSNGKWGWRMSSKKDSE